MALNFVISLINIPCMHLAGLVDPTKLPNDIIYQATMQPLSNFLFWVWFSTFDHHECIFRKQELDFFLVPGIHDFLWMTSLLLFELIFTIPWEKWENKRKYKLMKISFCGCSKLCNLISHLVGHLVWSGLQVAIHWRMLVKFHVLRQHPLVYKIEGSEYF